MSKSKPKAPLFANQRDYSFITKIEQEFFLSLASKKGHFKGRERPGNSCLTVESALDSTIQFVQAKDSNPLDLIVSFDLSNCNRRVDLDNMYLGTLLSPDKDIKKRQVTHFIALTKGDNCRIKLHVDLDFDVHPKEPKPSPHFQVGGRFKINNREFSIGWDDGLDKPRLPSLPFCTPLLWHSAFLEFQECESVQLFLSQPWWQNLVKKAESSIWSSFTSDMSAGLGKNCIIEALYYPTS